MGSRAASPFVGRADELRRLAEALALAAEGQGGVVFLTGQPGIGKTRLAREALALAKGRGFTVLEGRAYPLEVGLSYAPLIDAFGRLLRTSSPGRLAALVDGLPDLGRLFGALRLPVPSLPEALGDPALEKTRLFEAVMRLLERLAQEAPVALFVDDIHWADPASLELLHYLARGLPDQRALLIATYSNDALDASRGVRALLTALLRAGVAEEIVIPRLAPDGVDRLVRGILDGEVPNDLITLLDAHAAGTPLFVEALIDALVESGDLVRSPSHGRDSWLLKADGEITLPASVRRLILERLERLEPVERRVLDLIAVMGDATAHSVLRVASGLEEEALLDALRRLRDRGLVVERLDGSDVAYAISHPLIQEVANAELPEMARRRAHLAAIKAIESSAEGRPDDVNRIARHYRGAGSEANGDRALAALVAAGERALDLYANEEAARHFGAALAIVREGRHTEGGGWRVEGGERGLSTINRARVPSPLAGSAPASTLPHLLERLGEAWERTGARGAAVGLWKEALVERERAGDVVAVSRLRRQLAEAEWSRGQFEAAKAHLVAGLAALAGREPSQELAALHWARFNFVDRLGDLAGMADTATKLLSVAGSLPEGASPPAEANANLAACLVSLEHGDVTTARDHGLRALVIAEQGKELVICCRADGVLAIIGMRLGDHHFMRYHAEHGLAMARRLGVPTLEVILRSRIAYVDFVSGAWDDSLRHSVEAVALARRAGHPRDLAYALAARAMTLALQGELSEATACISEVRTAFGTSSKAVPVDRYVFGLVDIAETSLALERGQVERALSIASSFRVEGGGWRVETPPPSIRAGLLSAYMPMGLMLLAEAQVAAEEAESALETVRRLLALGPPGNSYLTALASRAEGLTMQALGRPEAAIACFAQAHDAFATLEMPFEAARSLLEQATSALAGRAVRTELAVKWAQQSLAVFERLGAQRYADRARRSLQALGITTQPARRLRLGGVSVSARELEIARLVAEGLTTAEIAERLTLSPLTVTYHLRRIYSRLGISSRTALARHVIEAGLA